MPASTRRPPAAAPRRRELDATTPLRRQPGTGTSRARTRIVRTAQRRLGLSTAIVAVMLVSPDADLRLILGSGIFAVIASTVPALIWVGHTEAAGAVTAQPARPVVPTAPRPIDPVPTHRPATYPAATYPAATYRPATYRPATDPAPIEVRSAEAADDWWPSGR